MRRWLPAVFILIALGLSLAVYNRLPDPMPVHWGVSGEPDRFGSKLQGAFMVPAIMVALFAVMQLLPSIDPRAGNIEKFRGSYDLIVGGTLAFTTIVHTVALGSALGWNVNMTSVVLGSLGALFVLLGNQLPRARSNFIFGIRTPWTLSSDDVWNRAHRIGGYSMVAAGLATIAAAFLPPAVGLAVALPSLLLSALVPVIYSYVLWSREQRTPPKA